MKKINALKLINLVIKTLEHTNTLLFQKFIFIFFAFTRFKDINIERSKGTFCRVEVQSSLHEEIFGLIAFNYLILTFEVIRSATLFDQTDSAN